MLDARDHLRREELNARYHALELAAILDRVERAGGAGALAEPGFRRVLDLLGIVARPRAPGERAAEILRSLSAP